VQKNLVGGARLRTLTAMKLEQADIAYFQRGETENPTF
jgi:hypothetical protein